jgi:hypothetical protein
MVSISLPAQVQNPTQTATGPIELAPIFRVDVIARTAQAVNYLHRGRATKVDLQGTPLMAAAKGSARVESLRGVIRISAEFKDLDQPSGFGPEYLTYVLSATSPDGRPLTLGELPLDHYGAGSSSDTTTMSDIQTFGMIVTAEPYYAVTLPSDVVVMENLVRPDTRGVIESINARLRTPAARTRARQNRGFVPVQVGKNSRAYEQRTTTEGNHAGIARHPPARATDQDCRRERNRFPSNSDPASCSSVRPGKIRCCRWEDLPRCRPRGR